MSTRFDNAADQLSRTTGNPLITLFTIMGWAMVKVAPAASGAVMSYGRSAGSIYYEYLATSTLVTSIWNGNASVNGATIVLNKWYHFALSVAGTGAGQCLGFLNGKLNITIAGNAPNVGDLITLGVAADLADPHNGRLCAVKIYDRALKEREVQAEMWSAYPVNWYKLNSFHLMRTGAASRFDNEGRGRHFTVAGTLTTEADPPGVTWAPPIARRKAVARLAAAGGGGVTEPRLERSIRGLNRGLMRGAA